MNVFNRQNILLMVFVAVVNLLVIGSVALAHGNTGNPLMDVLAEFSQEESETLLEDVTDSEQDDFTSNDVAEEQNEKDASADMTVSNDMSGLYSSLLLGKYKVGQGIVFEFQSDGSYSGYFDDQHPDVTGYTYTLKYDGSNYLLSIFNERKSAKVTYYVILTDDAGIILKYPQSNVEIKLEY